MSVKNRADTLGGQDWPNSIRALENAAKAEQNKTGPYCCVFGIAMEGGSRRIPRRRETKEVHSSNTEVWLSDFFWPFFSAYSYKEIMMIVLNTLMTEEEPVKVLPAQVRVPDPVLDAFGFECRRTELTDENGNFSDAVKLVQFFCQKTPPKLKPPKLPKPVKAPRPRKTKSG